MSRHEWRVDRALRRCQRRDIATTRRRALAADTRRELRTAGR